MADEITSAKNAVQERQTAVVSETVPDAGKVTAKLEGAVVDGDTVVLVVLSKDAGVTADEALAMIAPSAPDGSIVAVAVGLDTAASGPDIGSSTVVDLLDRAASINNRGDDALVSFVSLVHTKQSVAGVVVPEPDPVTAPDTSGGFPVLGGIGIAVAVAAATSVLMLRRLRKGVSDREPRFDTNDDGEVIGLSAERMTDRRWSELLRWLDMIEPDGLDRTQSENWSAIIRSMREIAPRWKRMTDAGLAGEVVTIATSYLPRTAKRYGSLPEDLRTRRDPRSGKSPRDALSAQLSLLLDRVRELRDRSFDDDLDDLSRQAVVVSSRYEDEFRNLR